MLSNFSRSLIRFNSTIVKPLATPSIVDFRIGKIIDIKRHENADKLYVSQIQIEQDKTDDGIVDDKVKTVQVCSGLVDFIPQSELLNARVVLVMNLKASKMRGVKSEAMLLAASNEKPGMLKEEIKVELVNPPKSLPIGHSLFFQNFKPSSSKEFKKLKPKNFVEVSRFLETDDNGNVIFNNIESEISYLGSEINDDICYVNSLKNCQVR